LALCLNATLRGKHSRDLVFLLGSRKREIYIESPCASGKCGYHKSSHTHAQTSRNFRNIIYFIKHVNILKYTSFFNSFSLFYPAASSFFLFLKKFSDMYMVVCATQCEGGFFFSSSRAMTRHMTIHSLRQLHGSS